MLTKHKRIDLDRDKLRILRERVRLRVEACETDQSRIHEGVFLAEVIADIDEIGWPDLGIRKNLKLHSEKI